MPEEKERWEAFVYRYPFVSSGTSEYLEENRLLEEAGYQAHVLHRGRTYHKTKGEAEKAVRDMMHKMRTLAPMIEWGGYVGLRIS